MENTQETENIPAKKKDIKQRLLPILDSIARRGFYAALLVGILPALVVLYFGYQMFVLPGNQQNETAAAEVAQMETEVSRGLAVERSEEAFKKEFAGTVALFYQSLPLLPKETEISNVLQGVKNTAASNNVELIGLESVKTGQKTANADKLYEREIPATVVGGYSDVMRFFLAVTRQTRILIVRDYKIKSADSGKNLRPKYVSVDFTLLAYHAPPTGEFPTVTMPGVEIPADAPFVP